MQALDHFPPTRTAALERLAAFVPHAGRDYAARRNYDLGPGQHSGVSQLSPYIRHRMLTEPEVLRATLGRFAPSSAEKFIQEVFWRTYWKGWLQLRPAVWDQYQSGLSGAWDAVQTQSGLRARWEAACQGQTDIEVFNHWAQELVQTGYVHNHARMWFASIWIFTLRLPWELGADFFLRHLLDGDPASNTLGWRWVAGIQTRGKTYLARPDNIARYTEGRFNPTGLARSAEPLDGRKTPDRRALPAAGMWAPDTDTGLILHHDDLSPGWLLDSGLAPRATAILRVPNGMSPLAPAPHIEAFRDGAIADMRTRYGDRLGAVTEISAAELPAWMAAQDLPQYVAPEAPIGPVHSALPASVIQARRDYDGAAWPYATAGFFKFKEKIPHLIDMLSLQRAA
ncbi:MAG: FAD-binding domain-containing protein [Pseudomonadota bacterium]